VRVQIWRSFASNNSASFYLVARFADREQAIDCAESLRGYIERNQAELDAMSGRERRANRDLTLANLELADELGIEWPTQVALGFADDIDIELAPLGEDLAIHHPYCLGFDEALQTYLEGRAAIVITEARANTLPSVSVVVHRGAAGDAQLLEALEAFFAEVVIFRTRSAFGFCAPAEPERFAELEAAIAAHPDCDVELAVDRAGDPERFAAIAAARCPECDAAELDYVASARTAAPTDQLACEGCGGMFELEGGADFDR
jgi:hypothetical protein